MMFRVVGSRASLPKHVIQLNELITNFVSNLSTYKQRIENKG